MAENGGSLKLFTQFVKARPRRPKRLILDIDATDVPLHGEQEGRRFHGYYDHCCYLPLYVFCGRYLLVASLRRSDADAARRGTVGRSWRCPGNCAAAPRRASPPPAGSSGCSVRCLTPRRPGAARGDTDLAHASPDRIRLTLPRIGAVVVRNTRRIRFLLSSICPHQELLRVVAWRLDSL